MPSTVVIAHQSVAQSGIRLDAIRAAESARARTHTHTPAHGESARRQAKAGKGAMDPTKGTVIFVFLALSHQALTAAWRMAPVA